MQLLRAGEFAIDCRNPGPSPALQLIARTRLRLFVSSALCSRLDRCIVGDQAVIAGESLVDITEEMDDVLGASEQGQMAKDDDAVEAVIYQGQQAAKQLCKDLHRSLL